MTRIVLEGQLEKEMRRASVATLKEQLSKFLDAVKAGEEIIVTERGTPVARLAPIGPVEREEAGLQRLIRAGLARPPQAKLPKDFWNRPRPSDPQGRSLAVLLEDRAESR